MLVVFAAFLVWMVMAAMKARANTEVEEIETLPGWKCLLFIVGGIIAIVIGGDLVVDAASNIAAAFGLSQTLIGLTIVAFGTSLPELVTSLVAAKKGETDMALGNVIGSNIFNILLVLGIAATVSPMTMLKENLIDAIILIVLSVLVWIFAWRKKKLNRAHGVIMIAIYAAYVVYICMR